MASKQTTAPPADASKQLLSDIEKGVPLAKAVTEDKSVPKLPTPGTSVSDVRHVMEELEKSGAKNLKHPEEIKDSSAPLIDPKTHIKTVDRGELLTEIEKGTKLAETETKDLSAPVIDPKVHIKTVDRTGFLTEVKSGTDLAHPNQIHDASAPKLPTATKASDVKNVMQELEHTGAKHLKHAETAHDASAPKIENVHIKKNDARKELAKEIQHGTTLEHAETDDRSAPVIDPHVHIGKNPHAALRKELLSATQPDPLLSLFALLDPVFFRNAETEVWRPTCDVKETDKEIIIHTELPGVPKENINVELKNNVLTIHGEKKQEKSHENEKIHRVERTYGNFSRSIAVPHGVTEDDIKASFKNGVLEVTFPLPNKKALETKKIQIH